MNQIRIAALRDLRNYIPTAHYFGRPHSIDADLELACLLLRSPEGLTLQEHRAAATLHDWALYEKRFRTISDAANPACDINNKTHSLGMTVDQKRELTARLDVHRRSALEYARALEDTQLIERYQPPAQERATDPSRRAMSPAPVELAGTLDALEVTEARAVFSMTRRGMIAAHKNEWPSILTDLAGAAHNGLAAAKAGPRGWLEHVALNWARANGKLIKADTPVDLLAQTMLTMGDLPSKKYLLKG